MSASLNGSPVGGGASAPSGSGVVTASGGAFVDPVASAATTRSTLGLGSLATASTVTASQISDSTSAGRAVLTAADASAQRTSLGLGGAAVLAVGTTAGTVAAGDDSRFLSVGTTSGTVAAGNDSRFITTGLDLARGAAATAGATYLATDSGVTYSDTGSAWVQDANAGLSGWSGATGKLTSTVPTGGTASNPRMG